MESPPSAGILTVMLTIEEWYTVRMQEHMPIATVSKLRRAGNHLSSFSCAFHVTDCL